MAIKMSKIVREFLAEFIGTFILIVIYLISFKQFLITFTLILKFIGLASIAITRGTKGGNILLIAFSWGFALLSAITIAGPISGTLSITFLN
jgi:glycerol uptake facilitator-like aquaporin